MSKNIITAILVEVGKPAKVIELEPKLKFLQAAVQGNIEVIYPYKDEVAIICNEEAKLLNKPLNRALCTEGISGREIYDIIAGDFLIVYAPIVSENFESFPNDLLNKYLTMYKYPEQFLIKQQTIFVYKDLI